jgi:hypothetical protein
MAFGKKKIAGSESINQQNVSLLASQALARARNTKVQLAMRFTGTSQLLVKQFGEKAIIQMLSTMCGLKLPRGNKDLTQEYEVSAYTNINDQEVLPCRVIKAAIVEGAISTDGVATKAGLKRSLRVLGHTAPIRNAKKSMDVRLVRNDNGGPDVRARAIYETGWYVDIVVQFSPSILAVDAVIAAAQAAGETIGMCEFRPDRSGEYGTFSVDVLREAHHVPRILKETSVLERIPVIPPELLRAFNALPEDALTDKAGKAKALVNGGKHNMETGAS